MANEIEKIAQKETLNYFESFVKCFFENDFGEHILAF